jgi:hypothetical protein
MDYWHRDGSTELWDVIENVGVDDAAAARLFDAGARQSKL